MTKEDTQLEKNPEFNHHKKKFYAILNALKRPGNDAFVSENLLNLISLMCRTVKTDPLLESDADVASCKKTLLRFVNKGSPKKVLAALLEQADDTYENHKYFCLMLEPLQCTLKRAPGMRGKTLRSVFHTLNAHIDALEEPEDLDIWGEEKLLINDHPVVQDALYVLSGYLNFIEVFVDEVSFENIKKEESHYFSRVFHQQELLHRYILKIFYRPLLYHDLNMVSDSRPKSILQTVCKGFIRCLSKICRNVFNLFKYDSLYNGRDKNFPKACTDEAEAVNSLAFSNLSYLIFVENIASDFRPFVYSCFFLFKKNLGHIILLLQSDWGLVVFKGLRLAETLLNRLDSEQLDYECIELEMFTEFPRLLLTIAYDESEVNVEVARELFNSYMSKCNYEGRYCVIMHMLSTIEDPNAQSLVIDLYSDYLDEALDGKTSAKCFLGKNFKVFVQKVFRLRDCVLKEDIVDNSEKLTALLTFLQYVLSRDDREINSTSVWDLTTYICENFMTPLGSMLSVARDRKEFLMKNLDKGKNKSLHTGRPCKQSITSVDKQKLIVSTSMDIIDLIATAYFEVQELIGPVTED